MRGYFDPLTGLPTLKGRLIVPRMNFVGDLYFLIDTGAETSLLSPDDGEDSLADYSGLRTVSRTQGTAGIGASFVERAHLAFTHVDGLSRFVYEIDMHILAPSRDLAGLPPLLGRDILDRWRMVDDRANGELAFDVHSADDSLPVAQ